MSGANLWLVCLDLDGPILDVSERYYRLYSDLSKQFGKQPPLPKDVYWNLKRNRVSEREILARSGINDENRINNYQQMRKQMIESPEYLRFDLVWPGVHDALKYLRSAAELVLVTLRNSFELLNSQLRELELLELFNRILARSPDSLGTDRSQMKSCLVSGEYHGYPLAGWFTGDTETDIKTGHLLGLHTAAITFGIRTVEHLEAASPDLLLNSPAEFGRWAEEVAKSPGNGRSLKMPTNET